jgi:hypothetical protein
MTLDCRRIFCFFLEMFGESERVHLQYGFPANIRSVNNRN